MKINLDALIVKFDDDTSDKLTTNWTWLIGIDKKVLLVSTIGDMFLTDDNKRVYWLDVSGGEFRLVADTTEDFEQKLKDIEQVNKWFMIRLATELRNSEKKLKDGQVYSYYKLPMIGGDYTVDNFGPLGIEEHFGYLGDIHRQLKDLPDGTRVHIKTVK